MNFTRAYTTLALLGCCALVGCNNHVKQKDITKDLTPEMRGVSLRPADAHNAFALTSNQNLRMLSDDLGNLFYTNTPSRLSRYPIVNNTGLAW
jgi:hypothetical protein